MSELEPLKQRLGETRGQAALVIKSHRPDPAESSTCRLSLPERHLVSVLFGVLRGYRNDRERSTLRLRFHPGWSEYSFQRGTSVSPQIERTTGRSITLPTGFIETHALSTEFRPSKDDKQSTFVMLGEEVIDDWLFLNGCIAKVSIGDNDRLDALGFVGSEFGVYNECPRINERGGSSRAMIGV